MPSETGKRYMCTNCGSELVVTKAGKSDLSCCSKPMVKK